MMTESLELAGGPRGGIGSLKEPGRVLDARVRSAAGRKAREEQRERQRSIKAAVEAGVRRPAV